MDTHRARARGSTWTRTARRPVAHAGLTWPRRIADGYRDGGRDEISAGPGFRVGAGVSRVLSTSVTPELDPAMTVRSPEGQSRCVIDRLRQSHEEHVDRGARGHAPRGPVVHTGLTWPRRIADGYRDGGRDEISAGPGFRVGAGASPVLSTSVTPELDPAMTVRLPETSIALRDRPIDAEPGFRTTHRLCEVKIKPGNF